MKLNPHLRRKNHSRQHGYVLIVMMLFLTLMAISLTAVAPAMVQRIRRERENELIHRGRQYARAIRLYYRKFGRYPARLEELENTNNIRFLRRRYKDPMTENGEWRLIHFGEAQVTLTGLPPALTGATTPSAAASAAAGLMSPTSAAALYMGAASAASPTATPSSSPQPAPGQAGVMTPSASADSSQAPSTGRSGETAPAGASAAQTSSSLGGRKFGGGPIVGVASTSKKESIKELNKKNHYNEWEFVYDPRLDLTMAQVPGAPGQQTPTAPGKLGPGTPTPAMQPAPTSPAMPGIQPPK